MFVFMFTDARCAEVRNIIQMILNIFKFITIILVM